MSQVPYIPGLPPAGPPAEHHAQPPHRRTGPILAVAAAVVLAAGAVAGGMYLLAGRPDNSSPPTARSPALAAATPSPTIDSAGRAACTAIHHKAHPGADGKSVPDAAAWQGWAKDVTSSADLAAQSSNRAIRRAGEDLKETLAGDSFIPAFVVEAATALRLACDREDYINLFGPDR